MKELLLEIVGWIGYLQRIPVALQLLLVFGLFKLNHHLQRRPPLQHCPKQLQSLIGPLSAALVGLLLSLSGLAVGLLQLLATLWLGWTLLNLLCEQLVRWFPESRVRQLHSRLLRPLYLLTAALLLINRLDSVNDLAVISVGELFGSSLTLGKVFSATLLTYLLLVGSGPPAAALAWLLQRSLGISDGSSKALELILRYSVISIGITALCFQLGLNSTALLAIAGGLSVGLGFGINQVFSNFISGIWLLFEGSVRPGEILMMEGDPCEVRRLGLRATLLWRGRDNAELLIPNEKLFTQAATSYTNSDNLRRSEVNIRAAYHHDPSEIITLLEKTARQVPRVLKHPAPKALLLNHGDSAIYYSLRFWIANPMHNVGICSEVNQEIWKAFKQNNIDIPFPQRVHYSMAWPPEYRTPNRHS